MAVSKLALGINARNYLYLKKFNRRKAKELVDDKLRTKELLIKKKIPAPGLIAVFRSFDDIRSFDWSKLQETFVIKPAHGYGGEGITVVRNWDGEKGELPSGKPVYLHELESLIFDIIDGAFSLSNLPDAAFMEELVTPHTMFKKYAPQGVPDIRVISCMKVPVMAMMRLPTIYSNGKANLHMRALGIGIDMRTGITTLGILNDDVVEFIPETKTKIRGIKIPQWDTILEIASKAQDVSGLGYAGVDIVIDDTHGPLVLEINARPGLSIQLANGASLRTRLERIVDVDIPSYEYGVDLAKRLFAESALSDVPMEDNVLQVIEKVTLYGTQGKKVVDAKVDTGAFRTSLDADLVDQLGLEPHDKHVSVKAGTGHQKRPTVEVTFKLRGKEIETLASFTDRKHMKYQMIVGRRDLAGFLVDPGVRDGKTPEKDFDEVDENDS